MEAGTEVQALMYHGYSEVEALAISDGLEKAQMSEEPIMYNNTNLTFMKITGVSLSVIACDRAIGDSGWMSLGYRKSTIYEVSMTGIIL